MLLAEEWNNSSRVSPDALLAHRTSNGPNGDVSKILLAEESGVLNLAGFKFTSTKLVVVSGQFGFRAGFCIGGIEGIVFDTLCIETRNSAGRNSELSRNPFVCTSIGLPCNNASLFGWCCWSWHGYSR